MYNIDLREGSTSFSARLEVDHAIDNHEFGIHISQSFGGDEYWLSDDLFDVTIQVDESSDIGKVIKAAIAGVKESSNDIKRFTIEQENELRKSLYQFPELCNIFSNIRYVLRDYSDNYIQTGYAQAQKQFSDLLTKPLIIV